MQVYEGAIVTCDSKDSVARYLVEERGRVAFVGDVLPQLWSAAPRVALGERALLPAFGDTHLHFSSYAVFSAGLDVRAARDIAEMGAMLRAYAAGHDEPILIGFGASAHSVAEKRLVSREDLDRFEPRRPVLMVKYDGHACIVNSRLREKLPVAIRALRGYHADSGEMNQEACFATIDYCTRTVTPARLLRAMLTGVDRMAAAGIGLMHAAEGVGFPRDLDVDLVRLFARGQAPRGFQTRVFFQTLDVGKVRRRKLPRIGGCFATALDGCFGSRDAALIAPYQGEPENRGVLFQEIGAVMEFARKANRAGLQIAMHAIGDAAFERAARVIAAALEDYPREDHRHTIIHACLTTDEGLELCARHKIAIALQPAFLHWGLEPLRYLESILGERAYRISPLRRMHELGIVMTGGSDAPCTLPDPIAGIHAACNHYVPEQSIPVMEAIKLFTRNAAWGSFDDRERGSLEVGKIADMVVLDRNPLDVPREHLGDLRVERLMLGGKPHVPGAGGVASLLWEAIRPARRRAVA